MIHNQAVARDPQVIVLYRGALYGGQLPIFESVQLPDIPVELQRIFIKASVIDRIGLFDLCLILLCDTGLAPGAGILIDFLHIIQNVKPGDPVSCAGTHAQTVLDNRTPCIRPADDPSVSFLRRGDDLSLCIARADPSASVPSCDSPGPGAQRRMIVGPLDLAGHITVLDQGSALCLADDPSDRHKPSH